MKRFRRQQLLGGVLLVLASVLAVALHVRWRHELPRYAYLTGGVLLGFMGLLTVYNARKKLPFLPLGSSEAWAQIHIYAGFFTVLLFLIHLNFRWPTGWFEITLTALYALVTLSGIVGLGFSRVLPRRLATRGGEVLYEKIPALRHALRERAEALTVGAESRSPVLAEFYVRELSGFFGGARHYWLHLADSRRPLNSLLTELDDLRRFLNDTEQAALEQLRQLVRQKDGLDYHHALQATLKLWLFVHLPLTYSLIIFTVLHVVLVFAFSGGAS